MPTQIPKTMTVTKWKTFDGKIFDTEAAAEKYEEENIDCKLIEAEIARLGKEGERITNNMRKYFEKDPDGNLIIIDTNKYGSNYYIATTVEEFLAVYWHIFAADRFDKYDDKKKLAETILEVGDRYAALAFVCQRSTYEYESVEEVFPIKVKL